MHGKGINEHFEAFSMQKPIKIVFGKDLHCGRCPIYTPNNFIKISRVCNFLVLHNMFILPASEGELNFFLSILIGCDQEIGT